MAVFIGGLSGLKNTIPAKSKQNQRNLTQAIFHGMRYNELVNLSQEAENNGDDKLQRKYERMQSAAFDKHLEALYELPKYEQKRVEKIVFG